MHVLDRVLERDDVARRVRLIAVDERRQRGGLARSGRPGDQHQALQGRSAPVDDRLGHAELLERRDRGSGMRVGAPSPPTGRGVGNTLAPDAVLVAPSRRRSRPPAVPNTVPTDFGREDLAHEVLDFLGGVHGLVARLDGPVDPEQGRGPARDVEVGAATHRQFFEVAIDRCRVDVNHGQRVGRSGTASSQIAVTWPLSVSSELAATTQLDGERNRTSWAAASSMSRSASASSSRHHRQEARPGGARGSAQRFVPVPEAAGPGPAHRRHRPRFQQSHHRGPRLGRDAEAQRPLAGQARPLSRRDRRDRGPRRGADQPFAQPSGAGRR